MLTSVWAREWQHKDILNDIDGLVWVDLSEVWLKYLSEGGENPALWSPPLAPKRLRCKLTNGFADVIGVCFTKPSKKKREAPLGSLSKVTECQVDTSGTSCSGKRKSSLANVGGIVWQRDNTRLLESSEVPHDVREGLMERVTILDTRI